MFVCFLVFDMVGIRWNIRLVRKSTDNEGCRLYFLCLFVYFCLNCIYQNIWLVFDIFDFVLNVYSCTVYTVHNLL